MQMTTARTIKGSLMLAGLCSTAALLAASTPAPDADGAAGSAVVPAVSADQAAAAAPPAADAVRYWPQWRGPLGTGEAPHATPPIEWSETKNIRWKVDVPGLGKSTPVVWKDLILITTALPKTVAAPASAAAGVGQGGRGPGGHPDVRAVEARQEFVVLALNRADGSVKWRRSVKEELPHEGGHKDATFASYSALTDGKRIYAFFGSRGLYALDFTGRILWEKQFGQMQTRMGFGEGASPAVHNDTVVVTWDHEADDFIVALDAATGKEKWRKQRDEPTTWATPHIVVHEKRAQVIVPGPNRLISYDLANGDIIWQSAGLTQNQIPSPVSGDGVVYAMGGFRGNMARAIKLSEAKGDLTGPPALLWSYERDTPYVPSPLLYKGGLYFLKSNSGILTNLDITSGQPRFTERLPEVPNVYASPVGADGRIYIVGRDGKTAVLAAGPKLEVLATNVLDDGFDASPALVDGDVYLRGRKSLYRIGATDTKPTAGSK